MRRRIFGLLTAAVTAAAAVPGQQCITAKAALSADKQEQSNARGWNADRIGTYQLKPEQDGSVSGTWDGIRECYFGNSCFRDDNALIGEIPVSDLTEAVFSYQAELEAEGLCYYGVTGYTTLPLSEFYIIDGWTTWQPPGSNYEPLKTVEIGGATYNIYQTKRESWADLDHFYYPVYWSVRQENTYQAGEKNTLSGTVPLTEHIKAWTELENGMDPEAVFRDLYFVLEAYGLENQPAAGTCSISAPECTLRQKSGKPVAEGGLSREEGLKDLFKPYFLLGAAPAENLFSSQPEYRSVCSKDFHSLTFRNALNPMWTVKDVSGSDAVMDFSGSLLDTDSILSEAERGGYAVCGSALVSDAAMIPEMYDCTPEEGIARIESIIRQTFSFIAEKHPELELDAYNVCGSLSKQTEDSWYGVFGADDGFIVKAYQFARQYAPEGCKLYLCDTLGDRDVFAVAEKIMQAGDDLDGIALSASYQNEFPADELEAKIKRCIALGLDVQITDVAFSKDGDYEAEETGDLWTQFFKLVMQYADHISAVTLAKPIDNPNMADEVSCGLYDCVYANGGSTLKIEPHPCYHDIVQMMQQLPEQKALTGDATCDGAVDVADAVLILRYAIADAEAKITDQGVKNGDADNNGQTDSDDAALVLQFIAKKTTF